MEIFRKKNEATVIAFPMVETANPENFDTGETVTDTAYYSDAGGAWTSLAITDTVSEIGVTGMYELSLTASEMNHDNIIIKFTSTNAADTAVVIRTRAVDEDDLVRATTPANTLDINAAGEVTLEASHPAVTFASVTITGLLDINDGVDISATTTNRHGLQATGNGTGEGIRGTGGATGHGILGVTSGEGVSGIHGLNTGAANGPGIGAQGGGTGAGINAVGGGTIGGHGIVGTGGALGGDGFRGVGTAGTTDGDGMQLIGSGDGAGLEITAGPDGPGLEITGGTTAGNAIDATVTSGLTFSYNGTELSAVVNAQVADVMKTDTITEMAQGAPPATPTFEEAVMYLYMAFRNKIDVDGSFKEFHNDAGTVIHKKALSDNGTTFSEAESQTGP